MARLNRGYLYSANPGAGQGTALRNFLNTNLQEWTVSALTTFGSGSTERVYWTLSHNSTNDEILFMAPNGTSVTNDQLSWNGNHDSLIQLFPTGTESIHVSYAPDGGFASALGNSFDPAVQAFWDNITVTQGKIPPSTTQYMMLWFPGGGDTIRDWFIEDTTRSSLTIIATRSSSPGYFGTHIMGRDLIDNTYNTTPADRIQTYGSLLIQPVFAGSTIRDLDEIRLNFWNKDNDLLMATMSTQADIEEFNSLIGVSAAAAENQAGQVPTLSIPMLASFGDGLEEGGFAEDDIPGIINPVYWRFVPDALNKFKQKIGNDNNDKFIHLNNGFIVPWDNNLAVPV